MLSVGPARENKNVWAPFTILEIRFKPYLLPSNTDCLGMSLHYLTVRIKSNAIMCKCISNYMVYNVLNVYHAVC